MTKERRNASSDPQLPFERESPFGDQFPGRILMSMSSETLDRKNSRGRYGSMDGAHRHRKNTDGTSCCVAGEHFLTSSSQDYLKRSLSMDSVVHVDISDINGDGENPFISQSLRRCQKILTPYTILLYVIGWRPWFKERLPRCSRLWSYLNIIYPIIVILFMLYHFVFQVLICQGKYNLQVDTQPPPTPTPSPTFNDFVREYSNCSVLQLVTGRCHMKQPAQQGECCFCQHIVPRYVVPFIMHFLAYGYGFIHFRIHECEQLHSLMERVFLQAHSTPGIQNVIIRNSRLYLLAAFVWLLLQIALELLYHFTFHNDVRLLESMKSIHYKYWHAMLGIKIVGMTLVHCVNVAIVINYCMQCEMLVFYIKGICLRLHEKTIELRGAMHEILGVRTFISLLNESMGKMLAFCTVNFTELTLVGTALLFMNKNNIPEVIAYRTAFPALWFAALIMPLLQASRLTRVGRKLRQISFEMRVFGYQTASQLDLDSFILFVNNATLRARLFGVSMKPATIILTVGAAVFTLLTLMVVGQVSVSGVQEI